MSIFLSKNSLVFALMLLLLVSLSALKPLQAQVVKQDPPELRGVSIEEKLGKKIPLDLKFTNAAGKVVRLGDYFKQQKPVVLNLAYYECPMLCTLVLNGVSDTVRKLSLMPDKDFQMVTVSIDPREGADLAAMKQQNYLKHLNRGSADSWAFLVGEESQSRALAAALGFNYYYDEKSQEYAHAAATFVLGEDGTISRYLYGIAYKERDLRFALVEASRGRVGTTLDKILLTCYRYDPDARGYVLFARNLMRLGGAVMVLLVIFFLAIFWGRERRRQQHGSTEPPQQDQPKRQATGGA